MNKDKALEGLSALENEAKELRKVIESPQKSKEERFWELILKTDSIKINKQKYPDSTFGFVGDKFLWQYDSKNQYLWLSYPLLWSVFKKEYNLKYEDIQSFIKFEVEEHFKCKGVTPRTCQTFSMALVEEHFKNLKL